MIQIRRGVFETNSSSTHSICIPKKTKRIVNEVYFGIGEYGWAHGSADPVSYLYTAILNLNPYNEDEVEEKLEKLTNILDDHGIVYKFEKPKLKKDSWSGEPYLDIGYIDHVGELCEFVEAVLNDEDMLLHYLSEGEVYTGSDNGDPDYSGCYIAYHTMYECGRDKNGDWYEKEYPNLYHDEEKYDYFFKGN